MTTRTLILSAILALALSACAGSREMPENGAGADEMKRSPCACIPLDYNSRGFTWAG